ncbi:MAG TPA: response regulator [Steroidobacteraceae bacterium]|nr:response regulator [Steroidobacteraceae bacterium]
MTHAMHRVLVVEGDQGIRDELRALLTAASYRFVGAQTGSRGEIEARNHRPDLMIAGLELPDCDGIDLIRRVRAWSAVPVIAISLHSSETQKITALDAGADDYVTTPFGTAELLARVRAVLRRSATGTLRSWEIQIGERVIDLARRELRGADPQNRLTPLEFRLLENLARKSGDVINHDCLIRQVWGTAQSSDTRGLRVCIRNLRAKLEPDAKRPRYLVTERGLGYRLRVDGAGVSVRS